MCHTEFAKLAGLLAKIAYELSDNEGLSEESREMLLNLWSEFDFYNHGKSAECPFERN
ncbi:hypothetical protein [Shouchella clausii]|uniref:hypothetical protein n=1 Tax=Shouchella clausii TaxID=79880 RepID=UPI0015CBDF88|nr:hypothetical protein [Shouchella clausii]